MKVIKSKKIEGCIEGKNVFDLLLSDKTTREFLTFLGDFGKLLLHESSYKPFFTLVVRGTFTLKGAVGNNTVRILLPDQSEEENLTESINLIELFPG